MKLFALGVGALIFTQSVLADEDAVKVRTQVTGYWAYLACRVENISEEPVRVTEITYVWKDENGKTTTEIPVPCYGSICTVKPHQKERIIGPYYPSPATENIECFATVE